MMDGGLIEGSEQIIIKEGEHNNKFDGQCIPIKKRNKDNFDESIQNYKPAENLMLVPNKCSGNITSTEEYLKCMDASFDYGVRRTYFYVSDEDDVQPLEYSCIPNVRETRYWRTDGNKPFAAGGTCSPGYEQSDALEEETVEESRTPAGCDPDAWIYNTCDPIKYRKKYHNLCKIVEEPIFPDHYISVKNQP